MESHWYWPFLRLMLAGSWVAFPGQDQVSWMYFPPVSNTLFLKPCHSFLKPKNNVLVWWISDGSVVTTGTRQCIFGEGSRRIRPCSWHLSHSPVASHSGRPQMPPHISRPGFEGRVHWAVPHDALLGGLVPFYYIDYTFGRHRGSWGCQIKYRTFN